jgi:hypothetical protein
LIILAVEADRRLTLTLRAAVPTVGLMHITAPCIAAAVVVGAVFGEAAAAAPPTVKTPDGTVVCFFEKPRTPRYVYCDWSNADDIAAEVRLRGQAALVASGGALDPTGVPVLRRGASKRVGRLRCTSRQYGMRCVSLVSLHGFRVGPRIEPQLFVAAKRCRTKPVSAGVFDVRATDVSCKRARRVAHTYYRTHQVRGWECREQRLDQEHFRVRCTRRDAAVRFDHGS